MGGASGPQRRAQQQGCRGQRGEIPAQRISANQHSPAQEASLLTRQGGWGLGAEAWASEVRSQGEDWGWLREHSLKGVSAPQLAGRESREKSGTAKEAKEHCFRGHEETGFRAPPKQAPEMGMSRGYQHGPRDRHETLRLLLQPPRSLNASTGHYPYLPSREPVHPPPLPWSRDPGTTSPGEHTSCLRLLQCHASLCCHRLTPHSVPLLPPGLSEPDRPSQLLF